MLARKASKQSFTQCQSHQKSFRSKLYVVLISREQRLIKTYFELVSAESFPIKAPLSVSLTRKASDQSSTQCQFHKKSSRSKLHLVLVSLEKLPIKALLSFSLTRKAFDQRPSVLCSLEKLSIKALLSVMLARKASKQSFTQCQSHQKSFRSKLYVVLISREQRLIKTYFELVSAESFPIKAPLSVSLTRKASDQSSPFC